MSGARSTRSLLSAKASSSALACAPLRGNPSRIAPFAASAFENRSSSIRIVMSSGTSWPRSMNRRASRPMADPSRTAARNRSPVAMFGMPSFSARRDAWVPFPAPGAPSRTMTFIARRRSPQPRPPSSDEAFVVAHHQLGFDLLHGLDDDGYDDQQARAAKSDRAEVREEDTDERRQDGDHAEEHRA